MTYVRTRANKQKLRGLSSEWRSATQQYGSTSLRLLLHIYRNDKVFCRIGSLYTRLDARVGMFSPAGLTSSTLENCPKPPSTKATEASPGMA